ncbi:MAG: hypothetical protein A2020_11730 [Lentisphaerae bacterium GWF2_45_14]|nr:MAG: hypothetical protein A2020_11730 [Lentisphaerae bacterium GWF2_45_14]
MNRPKILVAEDDSDMRLSLDVCLRVRGFDVLAVDDGDDALESLNLGTPREYSLLITDIVMGRMTGIELIDKVMKKFPELPVLVITGYNTRETAEALKKRKRNTVLYKPFSEDTLLCEIKRILPSFMLRGEV